MGRDSPSPPRRRLRRLLAPGAVGLLAVLLAIQLVPYGRDHARPAATKQAKLGTAEQQRLFRSACQDCHSFDTEWLWYSQIAPVAWLVQSDVDEGRKSLNLSGWDRPQPELERVVEQIREGEMPPTKYWLSPYHWDAKLSDAEKRRLIEGFRALYAMDPPPTESDDDRDRDRDRGGDDDRDRDQDRRHDRDGGGERDGGGDRDRD